MSSTLFPRFIEEEIWRYHGERVVECLGILLLVTVAKKEAKKENAPSERSSDGRN